MAAKKWFAEMRKAHKAQIKGAFKAEQKRAGGSLKNLLPSFLGGLEILPEVEIPAAPSLPLPSLHNDEDDDDFVGFVIREMNMRPRDAMVALRMAGYDNGDAALLLSDTDFKPGAVKKMEMEKDVEILARRLYARLLYTAPME